MGLLTNPNSNSDGGIMSFLERHHLLLAWACYVIGVAGIFVFPGSEWDYVVKFKANYNSLKSKYISHCFFYYCRLHSL